MTLPPTLRTLVLFNQALKGGYQIKAITKNAFFTTLVLCLLLTIGSPSIAAEEIIPDEPELSLDGQSITGHEVKKIFGNMDKINFSVAKPLLNEKFWAFVCDKLANGETPDHVSFYWHGDNGSNWLDRDKRQIIKQAKEIRSDTCWVTLYRPHSRSTYTWRSRKEMRYHLAVVDYFIENFGVGQFDVYGHSGGGAVATMVLQERRQHVRFAGISSSALAIKKEWPRVNNWWVYDPYHHIRKLSSSGPEIQPVCLLVVRDPRDKAMSDKAVLPYLERVRKLGLSDDQVRFVEVRATDQRRHRTRKNLGREMKKLKKKGDFCL